jgi:hypothetical protein
MDRMNLIARGSRASRMSAGGSTLSPRSGREKRVSQGPDRPGGGRFILRRASASEIARVLPSGRSRRGGKRCDPQIWLGRRPSVPGFEVDLQGPGRRAGPARACSWRARLHLHGGTTARIEVCRASTRVMRNGMVITGLHCGDADLLPCNGIEDQMQSRAG